MVDTQFLSSATPPLPVSPPTGTNGYTNQIAGKDRPASSQIGVTVTVLYSDQGTAKPVTTYTQIARAGGQHVARARRG